MAVQTALVGRFTSTPALAAFAAVGTCVAFVARAANFLVDGVSARVGKTVGERAWHDLGTHVLLSVRWSAALGAAAVPFLLAVRVPVLDSLLALSGEVQAAAAGYWAVRSAAIPLQLLCMAAAGILQVRGAGAGAAGASMPCHAPPMCMPPVQGFGHVRVNAGLTTAAAVLELAGSAIVLALGTGGPDSLVPMGCVTLACQALLAAASLACIAALPPAAAKGRVSLWREALGLSSSTGSGGGSAAREQPLLAAAEEAADRLPPSTSSAGVGLHSRHRLPGQAAPAGLDVEDELLQRPQRRLMDATTAQFLRDGRDMFIRTLVLQLTFFLALAAAARLEHGTVALAAHSIVGQLWVVVSYAVDGFAAAGIVLGSRLHGFAADPHLAPAVQRWVAHVGGTLP